MDAFEATLGQSGYFHSIATPQVATFPQLLSCTLRKSATILSVISPPALYLTGVTQNKRHFICFPNICVLDEI